MRNALNIVNLALIAVLCAAAVSVHDRADASSIKPITAPVQ